MQQKKEMSHGGGQQDPRLYVFTSNKKEYILAIKIGCRFAYDWILKDGEIVCEGEPLAIVQGRLVFCSFCRKRGNFESWKHDQESDSYQMVCSCIDDWVEPAGTMRTCPCQKLSQK